MDFLVFPPCQEGPAPEFIRWVRDHKVQLWCKKCDWNVATEAMMPPVAMDRTWWPYLCRSCGRLGCSEVSFELQQKTMGETYS